jgi:signal transduction histidine kinase
VLTKLDRIFIEIIDFTQTWSTFIYSFIGIILLSYLFYNNKLKEPLSILREAAARIADNDLEVELYYDSKDEMGDLCRSFDLMRKQLAENNRKMWDMMEEQKRLNAAFAHDLRTPLTVLRGYTDFLIKYVPHGKVSEEKLTSTLAMLSRHLERLERYSNTMKEINSLDDMPLRQAVTDTAKLQAIFKELIEALGDKSGIDFDFLPPKQPQKELYLDEAILMEVVENLISNALRYAKSKITVSMAFEETSRLLLVSVCDDGKGFTMKDLGMATKPYYKDNQEEKSYHFGIGLYISKILCEKHGGSIALANSLEGGAIVTASFFAAKLS